jgi:hypothetical protein
LGVGQNWHEAEQWLDLLARLGILDKEEREHPKVPGLFITVWWVPGEQLESIAETKVVEKPKATIEVD